ncbi:GyrI-like domain-containing protein [Micromonospora sp. WMMD1082]|uniref:GyrI-like domain-containing protein n=1 Tax=Micromonospora sp. WMMD1082 TaxID=3016104 RepID=UPI002417855A|nr:GyrI-like domain-containing protein [Micromonospora sp. WMMD1082]MDG4792790.1 GyrI-like domain-containing protein [Micromonospora sp. WMMD1082]
MFRIERREVAEQLVLCELHERLSQAELADHLRATMERLTELAEQHGGVAGPTFTIYRDDEFDPENITVETCMPIHREPAVPVAATVRREPAHHEVFVRLTKSQAVPPQVGEAFAAVAEYLEQHGLVEADAAREVYFTDFVAAGPDDLVMDVAFVIK